MERIVLEVDEKVAKAWRAASSKKKQEINMAVEMQVSKHLMKDSVVDYAQFLEELREKMAQRGLTQEILEDILNIIEVDEGVQKAYKKLSLKNKKQLQATINFWFKKLADDGDFNTYQDFLDKMGNEAEKNGLTLEIFQDIMELDDQTMKNLFGDEFRLGQ